MHVRSTLPNGIRVLSTPMPHVRSASITFYFGVGSRYETLELSGASHLIEHMLFKGSARYPTAQVISETIEGVGGVLDAATDKEVTVYSAKVASAHYPLAMDLIADMVRHPRMEAAELAKERRVIVEELNMYRDSPQEWVGVLADELMWPDLPLGREVAGTRETVEGMPADALDAYRRAHYVPGNLVVSVAGDLTHERVVDDVTRLLGDWAPREAQGWLPSPPPAGGPRVRLERRPIEQTNLTLLLPGVPHTSPDYYTVVLLNALLGDGMASRLFLEVRERQGLAYDVATSQAHFHDTGAFAVYAGVEPRQTVAALRAILVELGRITREPVDAEELRRAKEYSKGRMALRLEDTHSVASWIGGQELLLGRVYELDDVMARIDAVTAEDVQRVARDLFRSDALRLAVIGPNKDERELEQALSL